MGASEGRAVGEALLDHPDHELYDEAMPGEIAMAERLLKVQLPPSYKGMLEVGAGALLSNGDLLLGTKDPEGLGAMIHQVAQTAWDDGLPRHLLPILEGERFFCLDLETRDAEGEAPVVEIDTETLEELHRWPDFPAFARAILLTDDAPPAE